MSGLWVPPCSSGITWWTSSTVYTVPASGSPRTKDGLPHRRLVSFATWLRNAVSSPGSARSAHNLGRTCVGVQGRSAARLAVSRRGRRTDLLASLALPSPPLFVVRCGETPENQSLGSAGVFPIFQPLTVSHPKTGKSIAGFGYLLAEALSSLI